LTGGQGFFESEPIVWGGKGCESTEGESGFQRWQAALREAPEARGLGEESSGGKGRGAWEGRWVTKKTIKGGGSQQRESLRHIIANR